MRPSPSRVVGCSTKSQCWTMPAISTTRRSWISPQRPRTCGARSAVTRLLVSPWRRSCSSRSAAHGLRQRAVGLLAGALERVDLRLHLPERLAQRCDVRVQLGLRQVEERARALLHRLGRGRPHGARDALVERPALGVELRLGLDRATLERPHLERRARRRGRPHGARRRGARGAPARPPRRRWRCRRRCR